MPEELVEVSVFHVFKHHDERVTLHANSIERDNMLMLKVGQQFGLTVEVLPGILTGLFECLHTHTHTKRKHMSKWYFKKLTDKSYLLLFSAVELKQLNTAAKLLASSHS